MSITKVINFLLNYGNKKLNFMFYKREQLLNYFRYRKKLEF